MPYKLWHWDYFAKREEDIPPAERTDFYKKSKVFYKTWCKACLSQRMHELEEQDKMAKAQGRITHIRTTSQLRNAAMDSIDPIPNRREKLEAHIRACQLIEPSAKDCLRTDGALQLVPNITHLSLADSSASHTPVSSAPTTTSMSSEDQQRFNSDLCKLWVALGIPWHGINHPQAHIFFQNWRPDAKLPDRHKLSGPILQHEVKAARESMRHEIKGQVATGMSDGWKNIKRNALLASLLSTYTVNVHDLSTQRKTAQNHLNMVLNDIDSAEKQYNIRIIAWVSDAGGESRAMRVQLNRLRPHILVFDCWAHQINLIVGDILKLSSELVEAADQAINIIRWMLNHSYLLSLFHAEQLRLTGTTHTLNLPAITRWTAHFLSFTSLLTNARPLCSLVMFHPEEFEASARQLPEQVQQVKGIMQTIDDTGFWQKLTELKIYLEPLAIAANVAQAPTTRLDHILIELGRLYYTFLKSTMNVVIAACILNSLELRWGKSDQDPFIVCVVLNPYIRDGVFNRNSLFLTCSSLYGAVKRVFRRLFCKDMDLELHEAFMDYLDGRNEFHPDRWDFVERRASYERRGKPVNLLRIWSGVLVPNSSNVGRQQLVHLAMNVLSIVANSAGCERLFSEMKGIQSTCHSCLSNEKTFDTAVLRMELKRAHAAASLMRERLHRQFGLPTIKREDLPLLPGAEKEDQHDETAEELAEVDMSNKEPNIYGIKGLAKHLAQDVIDDEDLPEEDTDADAIDDNSLVGMKPSTESDKRPKHVRLFFGTQYPIKLQDLFNYDAADIEGQGLNIFKNAGLANLQKELKAYDLLTQDMHATNLADDSSN